MKTYTVRHYTPKDFDHWNAFISTAKNATFLYHRNFMEYHKDRFEDFSMMVFDKDKLVSVIPANKVGDRVYSHQGLTYGGFVFGTDIKLGEVIFIAKAVLEFLHQMGIAFFQIKMLPSIYNPLFAEEIKYVMFLTESQIIRRDCLSVINLKQPYSFTRGRKKSIRRGVKNGLVIKEELEFELFWDKILIPNLAKKHDVKPVHTAAEIISLHNKFPESIRHFNVYHQGKIVAGTTVFDTGWMVHPQYISGNPQKNELGSLDYLYDYLINDVFRDKNFFDLGPSHEENGRKINEGLLFWKESFGAQTVIQDFYQIPVSNFSLLNPF